MKHFFEKENPYNFPDKQGFFDEFGGQFVPEHILPILNELENAFEEAWADEEFLRELYQMQKDYAGRPSPLYHAKRLSEHYNKGKIYLKREDLNHTGAHKINNVLGQAALAKKMGKKKIVAETGAGQHGLATATACALYDIDCAIFMGEEDVKRQHVNVEKMELLGAKVHSISKGSKCLTDAVDAALEYWVENCQDTFYLLGSAVGPHPYPKMVRSFQSVIGNEAKYQILEKENRLPNYVLACVGGGSNAMGTFYSFLHHPEVKIIGIEAGGKGLETEFNCASLSKGKVGVLHGFKNYVLQDDEGNIKEAYSISAGLDYPGVGPEICYLKKSGRAEFHAITDDEAVRAFSLLTKLEGIIPAIESSHAVAYLEKLMPETSKDDIIILNLSGRGDKDVDRLLEIIK